MMNLANIDLIVAPFIGATVIGFANGFFSGFVNLRRSALSVSALSHTMLPGIALAVLITQQLTQANAFIGALFACILVGLGSVLVSRNSRIPESTALAVLYTAAFSGGIAILPHLPIIASLESWLFGDLSLMSMRDLNFIFIISTVSLALCNLFMRPLLLTMFEPNVASAQGVPVRAMQYLIFTLLILMLVASLQAVGSILSVSLLVGPSAIMLLFTDNTKSLFWGGAIIGALCGAGGVLLSQFINIHAGQAIVILLGVIFLLAFTFSPRYGILKK
ncbi:MAG: metal ABC transporter permease [Rubritalea sp.]|jgi:ABC-type Mn2+/Zn2+ transport system permease subunit|tara:strand:- start:6666 stop:7493 length:828 start_codon:yes stop_codon:yes gene_type:complete